MNKQTFLQKNRFKVIGAGVALLIFLTLYFSNMNSYKIETIDLTKLTTESVIVNDIERKVVPAKSLKMFFSENLGFYTETLFDTYDREYALLTEKEIIDFYPTYYAFEKEMKQIYVANRNDCDDFAKTYSRYFTIIWNKNKMDKISPAIGYFAYLKENDQAHMIVIAFTEQDGKLYPMFFELRPEFKKVQLTENEFLSMLGGGMN